jgi:hypothetical protein
VRDELIGAAVARQGGYEVIERNGKWVSVANALGLRSEMAYDVKEKYEEMLRQAAAELEDEDEDEEYEVEEILGTRTDEKGNVEYLVKWKLEREDDAVALARATTHPHSRPSLIVTPSSWPSLPQVDDAGPCDRDSTWEPRENLACPELLLGFEEREEQQRQKRQQHGRDAGNAEMWERGERERRERERADEWEGDKRGTDVRERRERETWERESRWVRGRQERDERASWCLRHGGERASWCLRHGGVRSGAPVAVWSEGYYPR